MVKKYTFASEKTMNDIGFVDTQNICQVLREVYKLSEKKEVRLKLRSIMYMAKRMDIRLREYKKKMEIGKMFKSIQIQTTTKCTRNCAWCPNDKLEQGKMSLENYEIIMENLLGIDYEGRIHPYLMAEPLCDERIFDIISLTRKFFPENIIFLYTNGDLLNEVVVRKMVEKPLELDGMAVSVYDEKNKWLPKAACMYPEFLHFMLKEDIAPTMYNRAGHVDVDCAEPRKSCDFLFDKMYINFKGEAILCCSDYGFEVIMGNALDESLSDIWEGEKYNTYRMMHKESKGKQMELCSKCNRIF